MPAGIIRCSGCFMAARCWPDAAAPACEATVSRGPVLRAGQSAWTPTTAFEGPCLVRSGCLKIQAVDAGGSERITGFALPGDIVGLESIGSRRHVDEAVAVTDTMLCRLDWPPQGDDTAAQARLATQLLERMGRQLRERVVVRHDAGPQQAVASFLRWLAGRIGRPEGATGAGQLAYELPMTRREIGLYLGLAEETVCRTLRRLELAGAAQITRRHVVLQPHAVAPAAAAAL
jgi:CRP/FNR family transcriptional regulator